MHLRAGSLRALVARGLFALVPNFNPLGNDRSNFGSRSNRMLEDEGEIEVPCLEPKLTLEQVFAGIEFEARDVKSNP